jgi:hypothetical protein
MQLRGASGSLAVAQPRFNNLGVSWVAPLGVIEDFTQRCVDLAGAPGQADTVNEGDVPAHWICVIAGPVKNPTFQMGQDFLSLSVEIYPGQIMSLNSRTKTVQIDGAVSTYQFIDRYSTWFRIPPGYTTMLFSSDTSVGVPTAIQLCWHSAWIA